jgi:hypothetical protein
MRRFLALPVAAGLVLVAVQAAAAKEPVDVKVSAMPTHLDRGQAWRMTISFSVHGRPWHAQGLQPYVFIENQRTHDSDFAYAVPTKRPGVYTARIVFPTRGNWSWSLGEAGPDGAKAHTVTIGPGGGSGFPLWPLVGGLAAAFVPAAAVFASRRYGRRAPASATA